jgi:hypothetical protein
MDRSGDITAMRRLPAIVVADPVAGLTEMLVTNITTTPSAVIRVFPISA